MIDIQHEQLCSLTDVARRLGVSLRTLYVWASPATSPRLETCKLGRVVRTSWEAVSRFSKQRASDEPIEPSPLAAANNTRERHNAAMALIRERHGKGSNRANQKQKENPSA